MTSLDSHRERIDFTAEHRWPLVVLLLVTLLARLLFLVAKPSSVTSIDAVLWEEAGREQYLGANPYQTGQFNWLPPLSWLAEGMYWFSLKTGAAFAAQLWAFLIGVELILVAATYRLITRFKPPRTARNTLLVAIALNPTAIFQTTQHASFHVVLMLYVLLTLDALAQYQLTRRPTFWTRACFWLGLGVLTKTVPLGLFPLLMSHARELPRKTLNAGALLLFGPVLTGLAIVIFAAPKMILQSVILYHSRGGNSLIFGLMAMIGGDGDVAWVEKYALVFALLLAISLAIWSVRLWFWPWRDPRQIILSASTIFLLVMTLGPGFASQYIYWLLPTFAATWALFDDRTLRRAILQAGVVTALTYTMIYGFVSSHGGLALHWFPHSTLFYRIELYLAEPQHETIAKMPMFLSCLSLLIISLLTLFRRKGVIKIGQ